MVLYCQLLLGPFPDVLNDPGLLFGCGGCFHTRAYNPLLHWGANPRAPPPLADVRVTAVGSVVWASEDET